MGRRDPCHAWRCLLHHDDSSHPMDAEPINHRQTRWLRTLAREVQFRFQVKTCLPCTEELPIVIEIGSRRGNLLANLHEMPQSLSVDQRYNRQWTCLSLRRIYQNIFNFSFQSLMNFLLVFIIFLPAAIRCERDFKLSKCHRWDW